MINQVLISNQRKMVSREREKERQWPSAWGGDAEREPGTGRAWGGALRAGRTAEANVPRRDRHPAGASEAPLRPSYQEPSASTVSPSPAPRTLPSPESPVLTSASRAC